MRSSVAICGQSILALLGAGPISTARKSVERGDAGGEDDEEKTQGATKPVDPFKGRIPDKGQPSRYAPRTPYPGGPSRPGVGAPKEK